MATVHSGTTSLTSERAGAEQAERRFYMIMALVMCGLVVAGFALNLGMGRSSFAVPMLYHVHAVVFMGWLALYAAQAITIATGRRALHIRLGTLAWLWVPAMVVLGTALMIAVARRTGGPFFFAVNEFLFSNIMLLFCFGGLALWSLKVNRHGGWHRRLMLCGMAILTGPGIGRLVPAPLLIPFAWEATTAMTLIFPLIAMLMDKRRRGSVHPALKWGTGLYVGTFALSLVLAYSPIGYAATDAVIAGTPGAERPMEAFLPPGFAM